MKFKIGDTFYIFTECEEDFKATSYKVDEIRIDKKGIFVISHGEYVLTRFGEGHREEEVFTREEIYLKIAEKWRNYKKEKK